MLWLGRPGIARIQLGQLAVVLTVVAGKVVERCEDRPAMQSLCRCRCAGEGKGRPIWCTSGAVQPARTRVLLIRTYMCAGRSLASPLRSLAIDLRVLGPLVFWMCTGLQCS